MRFGFSHLRSMLTWVASPFRCLATPFRFRARPSKFVPALGRSMRQGPWLADWRRVTWMPVYESVHPTAQRLILAAMRNEMLSLRYWGGSTPGRERRVSPGVVFQCGGRGPLYVVGYCHLRRAERVFRVDRVEIDAREDLIICITE